MNDVHYGFYAQRISNTIWWLGKMNPLLPLFLLSAYTANTAITLILLTLLTLLGEGPRIVRILEYCLIDHVYYIIPVVVVSWSILDVGKRDHFGQCFRLDWRLESGGSWVTSKMAGQVFRLQRILMTTLIQFHPLASLSRIWKDFKTFFGGYQVKSRKCTQV